MRYHWHLPWRLCCLCADSRKKTLQDILDLEREEVDQLPGMTPDLADKMMAFLNEMTEEGGEEEAGASGTADTKSA